MDLILSSLPSSSPFTPQFLPPHRLPLLLSLKTKTRRLVRTQRFASTFSGTLVNLISCGTPLYSFGFPGSSRILKILGKDDYDEPVLQSSERANSVSFTVDSSEPNKTLLNHIAKLIVYSLFCIAVGFSPFRTVRVPAIAAQVATKVVFNEKDQVEEKESSPGGHEFSECTRRLLETVSGVLKSIEEVKKGKVELKDVEAALKAVKLKKEELQEGILNELYVEVRELKREKEEFEKRLEEIVDEVVKAKGEYERLVMKGAGAGEEEKERVERLDEMLRMLEEEYNLKWERIGEIDDTILRRETVALSFGVRELCFIERECDQLVKRFTRERRQKSVRRYIF